MLTLRVPLTRNEHTLLICAYTPTLVTEEDKKDEFNEQFDAALREANNRDRIVLLGDFNARVGRRSDLWKGIGAHVTGKFN